MRYTTTEYTGFYGHMFIIFVTILYIHTVDTCAPKNFQLMATSKELRIVELKYLL